MPLRRLRPVKPLSLIALTTIAASTLVLSACSSPSTGANVSTSAPASASASAGVSSAVLTGHHWALQSATNVQGQRIDAFFPSPAKPMTLNFAEGRVNIAGGCNLRGGAYQINGGQLVVGPMPSTMMACEPPLMAADKSMANALAQPAAITVQPGTPATLTLVTATNDKLVFTGTPTLASQHGAPTRVFLEVAPQKVACNHPLMPNAQCLQTREIQFNEQGLRVGQPGPWQVFQGDIQGFTFEPGYRSVLRVDRYTRANPPADASRYIFVLDMRVETARVAP